MYLTDSVSVKDLNDKKNNFLFLKSNWLKTKYFIVVSHKKKKHFITPNIARMSKLQWKVWKTGICRITQISPLFKDFFHVIWVASQSIISPRKVL